MLGSDVGMVQRLGCFCRECQYLFYSRRVGNSSDHLPIRAGANMRFDLPPNCFQVQAQVPEYVDCDALPQPDQPEQQMLRPNEIVVEPPGFLAREIQHFLGAWGEIINLHFTMASGENIFRREQPVEKTQRLSSG